MTQQKIATIFGATGFIGRYVAQELAQRGYIIRAASRTPNKAFFLKPYGNVGQVVPFLCDGSKKDVEAAVKNADIVVNCVGILFEKKKGQFMSIHATLAEQIAKAASKQGVRRLVHISALSCDKAASKYAKSKRAGEIKVLKVFPEAIILRPSVVFGAEDQFFNMFARLGRVLPVLPLIGGGNTKFQPVSVSDVASAVIEAATATPAQYKKYAGEVFELGGPDVVDFKGIYAKLKQYAAIDFIAVPLPWKLAKMQASILGLLPKPILTMDQVESLKTDNVVSAKAKSFKQLGITPRSMDSILPEYLGQYSYKKKCSEQLAA
mgnify:CR=1 FL=1|jgi:NADH dehydrogenase|tara:strand:+ start:258488 stop:259450 length:963 start_codon:yes stop_codon:yes gene_type:complete